MTDRTNPGPVGPSQLARDMGVSIKTLKLYERKGLLRPKRTARGWRTYGDEDVERLTTALELKRMGFGLAEIATLLDASPVTMSAALGAQEARLAREQETLQSSLAILRRARRRLRREGSANDDLHAYRRALAA